MVRRESCCSGRCDHRASRSSRLAAAVAVATAGAAAASRCASNCAAAAFSAAPSKNFPRTAEAPRGRRIYDARRETRDMWYVAARGCPRAVLDCQIPMRDNGCNCLFSLTKSAVHRHRRSVSSPLLRSSKTHLASSFGGDDERSNRSGEGERALWRSNLRHGALYVHENFLDLLVPTYRRTLRAALSLCLGIGVTYRFDPELACRSMTAVRAALLSLDVAAVPMQWMASSLSFVLVVAGIVPVLAALTAAALVPGLLRMALRRIAGTFPAAGAPLGALAKGMDGVCLRIGTAAAALGAALRQEAEEGARTTAAADRSSEMIFDSFMERPVLFPISAFVIGPLAEELVSRRFIQSSLKRLFVSTPWSDGRVAEGGTTTATDPSPSSARRRLIFGHTPWVLISSVLFAVAHCANWTGPLRTMGADTLRPGRTESLGTATFLMTMAMSQMAASLYLSLRVYGPLFERRGVWASVGAHGMWNISLFFTVPVRIVAKGLDVLRSRVRK